MMKKLITASMLISVLLIASACVHPPTPHVKGDRPLMPPPPPLLFPAPPMLGFLDGYDVYVVVNVSENVVFYQGAWYRLHNYEWHRGSAHNGPWHKVPPGHIPRTLRGLPHNMKDRVKTQQHLKHHDVERNWRQWDKERKDKKQDRMERKKDRKERDMERPEKRGNSKDKRSKNKRGKNGDDKEDDNGKKGKKGKGRWK